MKPLFILIVSVLLYSCITTEKATNFLKKKGELAEICADHYPVIDTLFPGDTVIVTDTLETFDRDTITVSQIINDTLVIIKTPPPKIIRETKIIRDTIVRRDRAREAALEQQLTDAYKIIGERDKKITELTNDFNDMKKKRNKWRWIVFVIAGALGMLVFLRVKKIISL